MQDIQKNKKTIMLKIKNLTVEFNGKAVLNNFSLEVKKVKRLLLSVLPVPENPLYYGA